MDSLVSYFDAGYKYSVILLLLAKFHGIFISMRTLKRKLRRLGLRRRGNSNLNNDSLKRIIQVC